MCARNSRQVLVAEVAPYLRRYCCGKLDRISTNRMISFAAAIAKQRLWGRLKTAARHEETSVDQQALSVIGPLFREDGSLPPLAAALADTLDGDDISLFNRFHRVVIRSAAQELFHRWGENDPLSARLWRTFQRVLRHDPRIVAFPAGQPIMAVLATQENLRHDLPPVEHVKIVRIIAEAISINKGMAEIIVDVLTFAARVADKRNYFHTENLFAALRESVTRAAGAELMEHTPNNQDDPHLRLAIEKANEIARQEIDAKLDRYRRQGKLEPKQVKCFRQALGDLLVDYADGGPAQRYYQYLCYYWPDLTPETYRRELRAKFEYLAEILHQAFFTAIGKKLNIKNRQINPDATTNNQEERGEL